MSAQMILTFEPGSPFQGHVRRVPCVLLLALAALGLGSGCAPKADDIPAVDAGAVDAESDALLDDEVSTGRTGDGGGGPNVPVGQACTKNSDCGEGFCAGDPEFPGGYCTTLCTALIEVGETCPGGAVCTEVGPSVAACLDQCDATDRCRAGYHCEPIETNVSVCVPQCRVDKDCGTDRKCNTTSGLCEAYTAGEYPIGASCTDDLQCKSQLCVKTTGYTGGYCQDACPGGVASGQMCTGVGGVCFTSGPVGQQIDLCWSDCTTSLDCRTGYVCSVEGGFATTDKVGACVPKCQNFACATGLVCDPLGFCTRPPVVNATYTVEKISLGANPTSNLVSSTVTKTFTVPSDAVSFTVIGATSPQAGILPVKLLAPNGRKLVDINDPRGTSFRAIAFPEYPWGAMYPNDPALPMTPGLYSLSVAADRPTTATVDVLLKRGPTPTKGTLPVTLWFAKTTYPRTGALTAATAPSEPIFQAAIQKWREIYASADVALDAARITYRDVPAAAAARLGVIDSDEELSELFAVANSQNDEGLNMFFVDQFNMPGGAGLLGLSAGIPGVPSYPGLTHAGVCVALFPLYTTSNPIERADFAATMAHEAGHYLGLFHTTERRGTTHDPLLDTPECRGAQFDTNGDRYVSTGECRSVGADNLMFWTSDPSIVLADKVSPEQKWVLLRNPSVK